MNLTDAVPLKRVFMTSSLILICGVAATLLLAAGPNSAQTSQDGRSADIRAVTSLPSREKRWALIIGVDHYQKDISPLYGSVNDARALKNVLVRYAGFPDDQVILMVTDATDTELLPTRGNILDALDKLSRQVPASGLLLFSFSGHGVSVDKDAFLIPSDAKIYQSDELMRERAIDVLRIKKAIQFIGVKQVLMLIDACRNYPVRDKGDQINPLTEPYKLGFSFDTTNNEIDAFATIYATSLGDRAFEFFDERSQQYRGYFSYAIEEALSGKAANAKGQVTLASLITYLESTVKQRVYVEKNQRQIPYPVTEGFKNAELLLAVAPPIPANPPAVTAWESLPALAKRLAKYEFVGQFNENFARIELNNKWGFINRAGDVVVAPKYDVVCAFSEGLATVSLNNKVGFIDPTGRVVIPLQYDKANSFAEGLAAVELNGKVGFVDKKGKVAIPFRYDNAYSFAEGLAAVELDEKAGFIDKTGGIAISLTYDYAGNFVGGLAPIAIDHKFGFINKNGNTILAPEYDSAGEFSEGLVQVARETGTVPGSDGGLEAVYRWGFINVRGKEITTIQYDQTAAFSEGLAPVVRNNKLGFIDKSGKEIIPLTYDVDDCECSQFSDGLARVVLNKKYGFVNNRGSEVIPLKYDKIWCDAFRKEGLIGVELNGKKGFVDLFGNEYFDF